VVEHTLGKGEVESSILSNGTILSPFLPSESFLLWGVVLLLVPFEKKAP